jgi:hypothetical protein
MRPVMGQDQANDGKLVAKRATNVSTIQQGLRHFFIIAVVTYNKHTQLRFQRSMET